MAGSLYWTVAVAVAVAVMEEAIATSGLVCRERLSMLWD